MAGITLAQAQSILDKAVVALEEVMEKGQSLTIDSDGTSRTFTRADVAKLNELIKYWQDKVTVLSSPSGASGSRRRVRYVVPY